MTILQIILIPLSMLLITYYIIFISELLSEYNNKYRSGFEYNGKREFWLDLLIPFRLFVMPIVEAIQDIFNQDNK